MATANGVTFFEQKVQSEMIAAIYSGHVHAEVVINRARDRVVV